MKKFSILFLLALFSSTSFALEGLPELLMQAPPQKFDILGPISATMKSVEEAQSELLHQGKKLDADAVILKNCSSGAIERSGLTWYKSQAACEGLAIRYSKIPASQPAKALKTPL